MSSSKRERFRWRALLTETLPYEVPVIFSNDRLYASLISRPKRADTAVALEKLRLLCSAGTNPYSYRIRKDRGGWTELAIIHPCWQQTFSEFYDTYSQTILDYCRRSEFSLRRPTGITSSFSEHELEDSATPKLGIPRIDPEEGEIDVSRISSYFTYARYNLLNKFYDSNEFIALEKQFSRLRTLDVTKCFFSIYTHTITWAVKDREFAKKFRNAYSFERRFDELMQKANNNETNGIVVGPEASRIFAEIIFQDIDRRVASKVEGESPCAIRRYVDDYFIFANSESQLDKVEAIIRDELAAYKLFVNDQKVATSSRPFVSNITLARKKIVLVLQELKPIFGDLVACDDRKKFRRLTRAVRDRVGDIRLIVAECKIGFNTISGWLLATVKGTITELIASCKSGRTADQLEGVTDALLAILSVVFYICAMDLRVRSSYVLCQIISRIGEFRKTCNPDQYDRLAHMISEELLSLIRDHLPLSSELSKSESIELYNLLIAGAHYLGPEFTRNEVVRRALKEIVDQVRNGSVRYFAYITAHFCMAKDIPTYGADLDDLIRRTHKGLMDAGRERVKDDSELYLLMCDFLGSPWPLPALKRQLLNAMVGGSISNEGIDELTAHLGFVDWRGLKIEHTLARKELRPVYAWA